MVTRPRRLRQQDHHWNEDIHCAAVEGQPPRPILIDFYAQWCRPCKMLDVMVYNESEVIEELSNVLTFKVDIDKLEYRSLKEKFNISVLRNRLLFQKTNLVPARPGYDDSQTTSPHRSGSCGLEVKASNSCFSFFNTVPSP